MIKPEKIKYYENKPDKGIIYDWKKIKKEMKKLGIPPDVFNPVHLPFDLCKYFVEISERTIGKTTQFLLLGLIMYQMYGTTTIYVRQDEKDIAPKVTQDLFEVVQNPEYGYIEKINEKWNGVYYKSRRWYLCRYNSDGKMEEVDTNYFMYMCDVMHGINLKSGFNAPRGDLILFDEFVSICYYPNEFCKFEDLVSTIIRKRLSPVICLLSNNINKESQYYNELDIYDDIQNLKKGENCIHETEKGTKIYIEWISNEKVTERKRILNQLFFGFKNSQLASITGDDWAISSYPHIPEGIKEDQFLLRNVYIHHNNKYININLVFHDELGIIAICHKALYTYDDSIILSLQLQFNDKRLIYAEGLRSPKTEKLFKFIWNLKSQNKMFYQSNDIGHFINNYLSLCKGV